MLKFYVTYVTSLELKDMLKNSQGRCLIVAPKAILQSFRCERDYSCLKLLSEFNMDNRTRCIHITHSTATDKLHMVVQTTGLQDFLAIWNFRTLCAL